MRAPSNTNAESRRPGRRGRPVLVAIGFLLAFAATVATVILTGIWVRAPATDTEQRAESSRGPVPAND